MFKENSEYIKKVTSKLSKKNAEVVGKELFDHISFHKDYYNDISWMTKSQSNSPMSGWAMPKLPQSSSARWKNKRT